MIHVAILQMIDSIQHRFEGVVGNYRVSLKNNLTLRVSNFLDILTFDFCKILNGQ